MNKPNFSILLDSEKNDEYVIIDLETTGLYFKFWDEIISVSAKKIKNRKVVDTFHSLIKPRKAIPKKVTTLTGLDKDKLKNEPTKEEVLPKLRKFIGDSYLVIHNADFDFNFMNSWFEIMKIDLVKKYICTMKTFKSSYNQKYGKLSDLASYFNIEVKDAHTSMGDVNMTLAGFLKMMDDNVPMFKKELTEVDIFYVMQKRINNTAYFKKVLDVINDGGFKNFKFTKAFDEEIVDLLKSGMELTEIKRTLGKSDNVIMNTFFKWLNNTNSSKYYNLISDSNAIKAMDKCFKFANNDLIEALKIHKEAYKGNPNIPMYVMYYKLNLCDVEVVELNDEEVFEFFEDAYLIEDIVEELNSDIFTILKFFSKWLSLDEENREIYRDYIGTHILKKTQYFEFKSISDKIKYIESLSDIDVKVKYFFTNELINVDFFKI